LIEPPAVGAIHAAGPHGPRVRVLQQQRIDETVVQHKSGSTEQFKSTDGDQPGITWPATDQIHATNRRRC
jgi:hypothetical protein